MLPLVPGELVRAGELAAAVSPGAREGLLPGVGPRVGLHRDSQLVVSSGVPAAKICGRQKLVACWLMNGGLQNSVKRISSLHKMVKNRTRSSVSDEHFYFHF